MPFLSAISIHIRRGNEKELCYVEIAMHPQAREKNLQIRLEE